MSGKRARQAKALVDRTRLYEPLEAIRLIKELETAKFDETVEAHFKLGVNVRHADQQIRGTLTTAQLRDIAETKMPDLNANDVEAAMKVVAGTARSMGVEVQA